VAHNHPSGDLEVSPQDIEITKRLKESGELLGIHLPDHRYENRVEEYSLKL